MTTSHRLLPWILLAASLARALLFAEQATVVQTNGEVKFFQHGMPYKSLAIVHADGRLEVPGERILARAKIIAAEHEMEDGYFSIDHVTVAVPKGSVNVMFLREARYDEKEYELVLRPVVKVPQKLER